MAEYVHAPAGNKSMIEKAIREVKSARGNIIGSTAGAVVGVLLQWGISAAKKSSKDQIPHGHDHCEC